MMNENLEMNLDYIRRGEKVMFDCEEEEVKQSRGKKGKENGDEANNLINCFVLGNNRSVVMVGERRRCPGIGGEEGERDE